MLKNKKIIAILPVIILMAVLVPQHFVLADVADEWLGCPFSITSCLVDLNTLILEFLGNAISWAAGLLNSFIQYQTDSAVFGVKVIEDSWTIIRNFVNLFFVLVLIVMAFGTIFDIQKYTWKNMLVPFLIAALLINFSLAIGQYIITISNGLAKVFLNLIGDPSITFVQGAGLAKLATGGQANLLSGATQVVITGIFSLIFMLIAFLALFSAFIFSISRLFVLWFLLIISPIAWLGYALPNLRQKTWSDWWNKFLCWCFFLPYYLFFLMFAVIFINAKSSFLPLTGGNFPGVTMLANDFMFYGISLIFLVGGLGIARKLACASGTYVGKTFGAIETGVRRYAPGAAYVRGGVAGLKERGAEIQEKGLLGIGGAQRGRLQEATAKGWIAGVPGPGQVPGAREARERAEMVEIEKDGKRIREQLLRLPADQQKAFLEAEKSKKGTLGQAAELEFVKQGYSKLEDYQKATERNGGENSSFMRQYLENVRQAKLSDLFQSPDQELQIARGQIEGTVGLTNLRRELYKDLAKRNRINDVTVYEEAKDLLKPIPADLKSFLDSIKPEYIFGTKDARKEALLSLGTDGDLVRDADLAKKLVDYMTDKDKKEVTSIELREKVLAVVGGKEGFEGKRIINEINKFNPIINIEADLRQDLLLPTGPLLEEDQAKIVDTLTEKLGEKNLADIKKFSSDFFKDPLAQEALLKNYKEDPEAIAALVKGVSPEIKRALPKLKEVADKLAAEKKKQQRRYKNGPSDEEEPGEEENAKEEEDK